MNYQGWRQHRDQLLLTRDPLRLDCMNPFHALDHMRLPGGKSDGVAPDPESVAQAWAVCTGVELHKGCWILTRGVRSTLEAWCRTDQARDGCLWLPCDIFPTYWAIAQSAGLATRGFGTLSALELGALDAAGSKDCLVLPVPLSPVGRELDTSEVDGLLAWLDQSPQRILFLDLVYAYHGSGHAGLDRLRSTGQCIEAWSISKTWIQRQVFGVAVVPEGLKSALAPHLAPPSAAALTQAVACFNAQPDLPSRQQERFDAQWLSLRETVRTAHSKWCAPARGYFSVLPISAADLLEKHGMLAVPASVFGTSDEDLSVITCLHDIKRDDGAEL